MAGSTLRDAHQQLADALDALAAAASTASDDELVSVLPVCEGVARRLDQVAVTALAALERRGVFAERGYRSATSAVADLLACERFEARRRVVVAEHVGPRVGLDGAALPPRLPATAAVFAAGQASLRHVEAIARVLGTDSAARLDPDTWAAAEVQLAGKAGDYTPAELATWGAALIEALDADGPEPDDREPLQVNELHLTRHRHGAGGRIKGRFDDAALYDAIATAIDAHSAPRDADDHRSAGQRQAEALADLCRHVLDHGHLRDAGGRRPQITVTIGLDDLERRARAVVLDFGGTPTPTTLRLLACDAAVVPAVLDGDGQPLDVGRAKRTIPNGLRRAVTARDRGCAHPGCDRPPSWSEIHHIVPWEHGGPTRLSNLVMLCTHHHRQIHTTDWIVRIRDGLPEFLPPRWIDPERTPRRRPVPLVA